MDQKKKKGVKTGGSVMSDLTALTVPFGLIAARDTLKKFVTNREKELKKLRTEKEKPTSARLGKTRQKPRQKK